MLEVISAINHGLCPAINVIGDRLGLIHPFTLRSYLGGSAKFLGVVMRVVIYEWTKLVTTGHHRQAGTHSAVNIAPSSSIIALLR